MTVGSTANDHNKAYLSEKTKRTFPECLTSGRVRFCP